MYINKHFVVFFTSYSNKSQLALNGKVMVNKWDLRLILPVHKRMYSSGQKMHSITTDYTIAHKILHFQKLKPVLFCK